MRRHCISFGQRANAGAAGKDHGTNATNLLNHAKDCFQKSVALADYGTVPLVTRLYQLAQIQSRLGLRAEAAGSYGKVSEMLGGIKGSKLSGLWVEHLRIEQLTTKDSPEFRTLTERCCRDFRETGRQRCVRGNDARRLAISYCKEQQYAKSTELLNANLKKTPAHGATLMTRFGLP